MPPFWIRFPSATGWTCPNWPGRWRTRLRCSVTEAGCTPIFPRSFSPEPTSPNFAHHEYAQAACDYGYAGLGLMLALLALFLIFGLRSVLKLSGEHQRPNPLGPAAFCVLCIASFHAYGEFIWHNPALLGAVTLCGGITCTAPLSRVKASRRAGRWFPSDRRTADGHIGAVLCVSGFSGLEKLPSSRPGFLRQPAAHAGRAASYSLDPDLVRRNILHAASSSPPPKPSPAQSIGASGRKSGTPEPREPRPSTAAKSLLYILQGRSRKRSNCSAHT